MSVVNDGRATNDPPWPQGLPQIKCTGPAMRLQNVYKITSKAVWLGAVEATDEATRWRTPRRNSTSRPIRLDGNNRAPIGIVPGRLTSAQH
jgi:hypothetical protein